MSTVKFPRAKIRDILAFFVLRIITNFHDQVKWVSEELKLIKCHEATFRFCKKAFPFNSRAVLVVIAWFL